MASFEQHCECRHGFKFEVDFKKNCGESFIHKVQHKVSHAIQKFVEKNNLQSKSKIPT